MEMGSCSCNGESELAAGVLEDTCTVTYVSTLIMVCAAHICCLRGVASQECTRKATRGVYRPPVSLLSVGRPAQPPITPPLDLPLAFPEPAGPLPASP